MTRVDFYILPDDARNSLRLFACRLAEKAWQQGHRILIHTESVDESRSLDDLLWTFRDGSFIPHAMAGNEAQDEQPILISHDSAAGESFQVMINLSSRLPEQQDFERIAEIVNQDAARKQQGRDHYKIYRDRGFDLHHHEMSPS